MKYVIPIFLTLGTIVVTWVVADRDSFDECCEFVGLLAPDGVSEVPGQEHVTFEAAENGKLPASVPGIRIGEAAGEISLLDIQGKQHTVNFKKTKFTAIIWVSSFCPTSKIYEERITELADDFKSDVQWYAINSSAMESLGELNEHFGNSKWTLPVLKEDGAVLADRFGARVTTETFVFEQDGKLLYRGGIDDARKPLKVEHEYLRNVLEALIDGDSVPFEYQPAKGCCPIDRLGEDEESADTPELLDTDNAKAAK
ncbi:redoxin domain-containing protein [Planctomycetota bacterium]|nr:redoxin domain-containing protein [Planctomycetota bacterium]